MTRPSDESKPPATPSDLPPAEATAGEPSAVASEPADGSSAASAGSEAAPARAAKPARSRPKGKRKPNARRAAVKLTPWARAWRWIKRNEGKTWAIAIVSILLVELYVFGSRGSIQVCVGREGVTDFSLRDQRPTAETRGRVPSCETRYNVGMRSYFDDRLKEATYLACRRATIVSGIEERAACFGSMRPWQKQVEVRYVAPWEQVFYETFLWFLF